MTAKKKPKEPEQEPAAEAPAEAPVAPSLLRRFTTGPWLALVVGCIGIAATLVTYLLMCKSPELTYCVSDARAAIVRAGEVSELDVSHGGRKITDDVTAVQIAVWNAGKQAIRPEHILSPVTIRTEPKVRVLEANVRKMTRDVVALAAKVPDPASGRVDLAWRILERNDGGVVQIVFEGERDAKVQVEGIVEGQASVRGEDMQASKVSRRKRQVIFEALLLGILVVSTTMMTIWLGGMTLRLRRQLKRIGLSGFGAPRIGTVSDLLPVGMLIVVVFLVLNRFFSSNRPPFGF